MSKTQSNHWTKRMMNIRLTTWDPRNCPGPEDRRPTKLTQAGGYRDSLLGTARYFIVYCIYWNYCYFMYLLILFALFDFYLSMFNNYDFRVVYFCRIIICMCIHAYVYTLIYYLFMCFILFCCIVYFLFNWFDCCHVYFVVFVPNSCWPEPLPKG